MAAIHPTMTRLYAASASLTGGKVGQSALARLLNTSPQRIKNWEERGVSQQGATQVQAELGVNATWLLTGAGQMLVNASPTLSVREPSAHGGPASQSVTLDPEILYEALTLLLYDETQAGAYTPRAQARRLADLYGWVAAEGGRLSPASNRTFEDQVAGRRTGVKDDERVGKVWRGRAVEG